MIGKLLIGENATTHRPGTQVSIGDKVIYRPGFGSGSPEETTVDLIQHGEENVESAPWESVTSDQYTLKLSNGFWAPGNQVVPVEDEP